VSDPLVSVVICTWNCSRYLSETVSSALAQTWPNLEVIVVDDGSTDDTRAVIAPFLGRVRYEPRTHQGLAAARNEGIRLAAGELVALLDADDLWAPEKIATQVEIARRRPESGLVACNGVEFADDTVCRAELLSVRFTHALAESPAGEVTGDFQREMFAGPGICCPAQVLIPRPVLRRVGPFIDSGAQDYDYYLRVSLRYPITVHKHRHVRWRYRADSLSGARADRHVRWGLDSLPVLLAHRRRCRPEHRELLEVRIRALTSSLGYHLMIQGRASGRLSATSRLLAVLRARPWSPALLVYLAGLWSPSTAYRVGTQLIRSFRGGD
jgi:glycosyltransferase involved in cell wall biosynthesis